MGALMARRHVIRVTWDTHFEALRPEYVRLVVTGTELNLHVLVSSSLPTWIVFDQYFYVISLIDEITRIT